MQQLDAQSKHKPEHSKLWISKPVFGGIWRNAEKRFRSNTRAARATLVGGHWAIVAVIVDVYGGGGGDGRCNVSKSDS